MNKYKKLAFNTAVFAIGSFGSKILVLLLTRLYTKHISPPDMNTKDLLETTALFLQPIFTFALQEYLIRFGLDKKKNCFLYLRLHNFCRLNRCYSHRPRITLYPYSEFPQGQRYSARYIRRYVITQNAFRSIRKVKRYG